MEQSNHAYDQLAADIKQYCPEWNDLRTAEQRLREVCENKLILDDLVPQTQPRASKKLLARAAKSINVITSSWKPKGGTPL